ncbi:alanine/glycine:cation symporter family protein [Demetria terragena]|uniref:alanine/glycine:cation symporter family protein n=1 Tax=Demetria terragena TaxID=63959 RepID=UPI00035DF79D|nr:alanine/glycine:cation symporter family protein [Demetria terragena]
MNAVNDFLADKGDLFWTWAVLPVVVVLGLYFTVRTGVVQIRLLPSMVRVLRDPTPRNADGEAQSISAFQAFTVSAASRVGVGNIAGVGTAIVLGGPGAVFWMWLMAIVGGASSFVESTLGQLYKVRDKDGFRGGPAYYMQHGLGRRWVGVLFAVVLIVCFPLAFSSLQANTIVATLESTSGHGGNAMAWGLGLAVAGLTALVIFGGIRRIAQVTESVVPLMALLYLVVGVVIVAQNIGEVPGMIQTIVSDAFTANSATGAAVGSVILAGVKRGMFSNEAGLGSAPNAGASAAVTHPVKQGLVQTLGVYFDTLIVCSITAFIILASQQDYTDAAKGIDLTYGAVTGGLGEWAGWLLAVIIFLLAFSSIIGNYYYGQANVEFISDNPMVLTGFRALACAAVLVGAVLSADVVWTFADGIMGVMALINLISIAVLSGIAFRLLKDYREQSARGEDPVFIRGTVEVPGHVETWASREDVVGPETAARRPRDD